MLVELSSTYLSIMTSLGLVLRCCVKVRIRVSVRVKASFGLGCRVSFRVRVRVPGTNIACVSVENQREWVFKCQHMSYCRTLSEQSLLFNCVHQFFIVLFMDAWRNSSICRYWQTHRLAG